MPRIVRDSLPWTFASISSETFSMFTKHRRRHTVQNPFSPHAVLCPPSPPPSHAVEIQCLTGSVASGLVPWRDDGMLIPRSSVAPSKRNIDIKLSVNSPAKLNCQRPVVVRLRSIQKDKPSAPCWKALNYSWPIKYLGWG